MLHGLYKNKNFYLKVDKTFPNPKTLQNQVYGSWNIFRVKVGFRVFPITFLNWEKGN